MAGHFLRHFTTTYSKAPTIPLIDLSGKVAVVTGGNGAIGQAIMKTLKSHGAIAIALSRQSSNNCDVRSRSSVQTAIDATWNRYKRIDILVHAAGITHDALMIKQTEQQLIDVMETNLISAFHVARATLKHMLTSHSGRIIFIGSVVGSTGNAGQTAYAASKAGLEGLTKSLAKEVASRNVLVNCLAPGFVESPMTDKLSESIREKWLSKIPLQRFGRPEDVSNLVCFLCSEHATYITGQVLKVDGGMT